MHQANVCFCCERFNKKQLWGGRQAVPASQGGRPTTSDGNLKLAEIAELGRRRGYSFIAVCDHSQSVKYARGLSPERLRRQMREIDALNAALKDGRFRLLKGSEVDILADGSLDFSDALLKELDFVVAAVHSGFKRNVTERILKALANPYVKSIAHPTGRLLSGREGYDVDIEKVLSGAKRLGKALELNAYYDRLDLDEFNCPAPQHCRSP